MAIVGALIGIPGGPVIASPDAVGVSLEAPTGARVGDVVPLDLAIDLGRSFPGRDLDLELSEGLRPVGLPRSCRFDALTWRVACDLPEDAGRDQHISMRIDVLATAPGNGYVRPFVGVPGGAPDAWGSTGLTITMPDVVRRYAPQFRFHRLESRWPGSVETLLADSSLMYARDACPDATVIEAGDVTPEQLGMPGGGDPVSWPRDGGDLCDRGDPVQVTTEDTRPGGQDGFYQKAAMPGSKEGFYLAFGPAAQAGVPPSDGARAYGAAAPVYVQYRPGGPGIGDGWIRYWVLYGCSYPATLVDPRFAKPREGECFHQGDWEGVAVRLDRDTGTATDIAYFAHEEDADIRVFAPDGPDPFVDPVVEVVAGDGETTPTHPVVYVGAGSHSSRTGAGDHEACLELKEQIVYCGTDQTADDVRWDTWAGDVRSAEEAWFGFGGAWGAVGPVAAAAGVHGPGGPGLVDPLPKLWLDKDVPRCRPGEAHPESTGTGTSCDPSTGTQAGIRWISPMAGEVFTDQQLEVDLSSLPRANRVATVRFLGTLDGDGPRELCAVSREDRERIETNFGLAATSRWRCRWDRPDGLEGPVHLVARAEGRTGRTIAEVPLDADAGPPPTRRRGYLLGGIPPTIRETCVRRPGQLVSGTVAAVDCRPGGAIDLAAYYLVRGDGAQDVFEERMSEQTRGRAGDCARGRPGTQYLTFMRRQPPPPDNPPGVVSVSVVVTSDPDVFLSIGCYVDSDGIANLRFAATPIGTSCASAYWAVVGTSGDIATLWKDYAERVTRPWRAPGSPPPDVTGCGG